MKLMTIVEVAELLQVAKESLYHWVAEKEIPYYKIGGSLRFDADEIKAWIKARKNKELK